MPLSKKEIEVLNLLKDGKTSAEIATHFNISKRTVNFHVKNIVMKLKAKNRTHAVAIALTGRMLDV